MGFIHPLQRESQIRGIKEKAQNLYQGAAEHHRIRPYP